MATDSLGFEDVTPDDSLIAIPSFWKANIPPLVTSSTATEPTNQEDEETQTIESSVVATQTEDPNASGRHKANAPGLGAFLKKVDGLLAQEFTRSAEELEYLEPLTKTSQEDEQAQLWLDLRPYGDESVTYNGARLNKHQLVVTSLSWSATGQTIAASYGRYDIVGWCTFPGVLMTWNLARGEINQERPDNKLEADTCLMCCAFHPTHPALIAGGSFNGDIFIWDLSCEGDLQRGRSDPLCEARHREPITAIHWAYSMVEAGKYASKDKAYRLVTLGVDGRILVWRWSKVEQPIYGYELLWPGPHGSMVMWGGTCMTFDKKAMGDSATFLVGSEGGRVFKCYYDLNDAASKEFAKALAGGKPPEMRAPIKDTDYDRHAGAVYGIDFSPFQNDLFLSCGTDGVIHLHHLLRKQALLVLEPAASDLYGVQWSPFRPLVFATCSGDGCCYLYDLLRVKDLIRPVLVLPVNSGAPVYCGVFNHKRPDLFATGDAGGIKVWRLPPALTGVRRGESQLIKRMAAADHVDELLKHHRL